MRIGGGPLPNVMVCGGLLPIVTVSCWPDDTTPWVTRSVGPLLETERPSSPSAVPPVMFNGVSASWLVSTSWLEPLTVALMPVVPVTALISVCTCAAVSPALTVIVWLPVPVSAIVPVVLSGNVIAVPVTAVGGTVAPEPVIAPGVRAPTSGFDAKVEGLSRFDPATPDSVLVVVGWLGRLALYWTCEVSCAGIRLLLNCSTCGMLPTGLPVAGSSGMPSR